MTRQVGLEDFIRPASAISRNSETINTEARMELLRQNPPIYFERNLRNMIAVSKEHGVKILLATWAYNPFLEDYASTEYYQQGFRESNEIIRKVAEQHDVPLLDFSSIMPDDLIYWADGRHVNEEGALLKAELFARFIDEQQLVPR